VLVWDPGASQRGPVELGFHERDAAVAVAALPDGRVVTCGGRVAVWNPSDPDAGPVEIGDNSGGVPAVAVLPDCRVVAISDGRVLVWDPAEPGAGPVEIGRDDEDGVGVAVAGLPDGRVVTGGDDDRVRLWNVRGGSPDTVLACSAHALTAALTASGARLFIGHAVGGISCWEVRPAAQNTPGPAPGLGLLACAESPGEGWWGCRWCRCGSGWSRSLWTWAPRWLRGTGTGRGSGWAAGWF
jgi:WD40 repeat protein